VLFFYLYTVVYAICLSKVYIFDFLRGHLDGDGCFYSYWDKRWKRSYMFYTVFIFASKEHIDWIQKELNNKLKIKGHINRSGNHSIYQLKYAKKECNSPHLPKYPCF
jgi:intein-encoded DNA endonuclease-like protein